MSVGVAGGGTGQEVQSFRRIPEKREETDQIKSIKEHEREREKNQK